MSSTPSYRPVVLIRGILLAALALFLGGVVAVFVFNRAGTEGRDRGGREGLDVDLAELITLGKGFDLEVTDGDKRLYRISADRILASRDNVVTLEGIVIAVERESGDVYRLTAKSGAYRPDRNSAEVEGDVVLTGPDGIELRSDKFDLLRKGTLVKSRGAVEFSAGKGITGSARELEAFLKKDEFHLLGNVRLDRQSEDGESDLTLAADRVVYDQTAGLIHAEGGVRLASGRDRMSCDRIAVTLAGEGDSETAGSRFVRARLNVVGFIVSDDSRGFERRLGFVGDEASIAYGRRGSEPRLAEIVGTEARPARLDSSDETGWVRRFSSRRIEATFARGAVREVRTEQAVTLTEFLQVAPDRELARICGGSALAKFGARGELTRFEIGGGADLHRAGFQATGEAMVVSGKDTVEVRGEPAHVYTLDGELTAPKLVHDEADGKVTASGGVRAWFPPGGGVTMVKATESTDELPVQVTAESANWRPAADRFEFEGDVRAWQGESFLTAQLLIGQNGGRIRGEGGVQTTLERSKSDEESSDSDTPRPKARGPVRVTADSFDYDKTTGLIQYRGSPEVRDAGRLMSCDELAVFLKNDSNLDRLECRGNALIDDRVGERKVRGALAVYRPDDGKVEVTGSPVILERPDGAVVRASRVVYDFETTIAQFQSASSTVTNPGGGG